MALAPAVSTAAQRALQTPAVFNVLPASFQPRQTYDVSPDIPRSYFLGHHRAALSSMRQVLANIGLIIECRDLRVPISSWNPLLEQSLSGARSDRDRIIVYTHRDLCPDSPSPFPYATSTSTASAVRHLRDFHARHNHAKQVLFLGAGAGADRDNHQARHHNHSHSHTRQVATLLEAIKSVARERDSLTGLRAMVVGMPNAGKSTLLNRLRARGGMARAKAARTGSQPGVTRRLSTPVRITGRESEDADADTDTDTSGLGEGVFLVDAPGVFVPYVSDPEAMLKLALVGCVHDGLVPRLTLADYLLFRLNLADPRAYVRRFGMAAPTNDVHELLRAAALRMGKLAKRGEADLEAAAESVVRDWRRGWLGRLVLDDVTPETLARAVEAAREPTVSMNQARKREKEARKAKREARRLGGLGDGDDGPL